MAKQILTSLSIVLILKWTNSWLFWITTVWQAIANSMGPKYVWGSSEKNIHRNLIIRFLWMEISTKISEGTLSWLIKLR